LQETQIEGTATTIPAHLAILEHDDFINARHSTKWVEDTLDLSQIEAPTPAVVAAADGAEPKVERDVDVEVDGRKFTVKLWVPDVAPVAVAAARGSAGSAGPKARARPRPGGGVGAGGAAGSGTVTVPMQGTIVKVLVVEGDTVEVGQAVCILEAMKMENQILAEKAGTVKAVRVSPGDTVGTGDVVAEID
jgi:acetyl-CoA/propionyl-CoA carboxylase biotin carboxyl carrier protein